MFSNLERNEAPCLAESANYIVKQIYLTHIQTNNIVIFHYFIILHIFTELLG